MKVVFVTYDRPKDVGGVSAWLQRLLPQLQEARFDVEVHVFAAQEGSNCAEFSRLGIPFRLIPVEPDARWAVRNCLKGIEASQPDIYVPNCIVPAYFAAGYARRQGIHTVGVLHSDDPFYWGIVDEFMKGKPAFRLSAIVPVSQFLQDAVAAFAVQNAVITRRIGCGVPLSNAMARQPDRIFRLIYAGRLEEDQKCISQVVRSLCAAVKANPMVEAWIVGEGSARAKVEQIISESMIDPHRIKLLGRIELSKIYSVFQQCHAFVLLSDYEGLPVAMLEAMAVGLVPVCLDMRSGIREAIQPGLNGLIVEDREQDFLSTVQTLQSDPQLWSRLSANAHATVKARFSEAICAAAWMELLGSLGKKKCRTPFKSPRFIALPQPNRKFGTYDQRTPVLRKSWNKIRMTLGYYRRRLLQAPGHNLV